jgi:excisionase family DNA binding protein
MSAKSIPEPMVLTVSEMADLLRIRRDAAYQLCRQHGFPAARIGRFIRIPAAALERWIEEQACTAVQPKKGFPSRTTT